MSNTVIPVPYRLDMVIGFHPKAINCDGCPFCLTDAFNRDRKRCVLTDEVLYFTKEMDNTFQNLNFQVLSFRAVE